MKIEINTFYKSNLKTKSDLYLLQNLIRVY